MKSNEIHLPARAPELVSVGELFAKDAINSLQQPPSDEEAAEINKLIDLEAEQVATATREAEHTEYVKARKAKELAGAEEQENRSRLDAVTRVVANLRDSPGDLLMAVIALICITAAVVSEFEVSRSGLCYVLGIKQHSFAGIMLGASATTALMALKIVFAVLIWEPWQAARVDPAKKGRIARWAVAIGFFIFIGLLTIHTVARINEARSQANRAKAHAEQIVDGGEEPVDMKKVDQAINAITLCLVINGALFCLIALSELKRISAYWRSLFLLTYLRLRHRRLVRKAAWTDAQLAVKEAVWSQIEERAQKSADHYRTRLNLLLQQAAQRRSRPRANRDLVHELLAARLEAPKTGQ